MKRKPIYKAIIAIAVAMAFIMPVTAGANVGTFGVTSNSENTGDMEIMVETSTNSDNSDNIEIISDVEKPFIDTEELSIVNDAGSIVSATGRTIYVDDDADPGWYNETQVRTIQEGVNNATTGDTVYVYNGTYYENVLVNKTVDLIGENRENVIVDGGGTGNVVKVTVDNVGISTFTLTNSSYGLHVYESSDCDITNCDAYNNSAFGICLFESSDCNVANCDVYSNEYGIFLYHSSNNSISNCNAYNSNNTYGIYLDLSSGNDISNCNFYNNSEGIYLLTAPNNSIVDCNTYDNSNNGIWLSYSSNNSVIDCNTYNNYYGIQIYRTLTCKLSGNTIYDNARNLFFRAWYHLELFYHDIDATNMVDGKPIWYLVEQSNITLDETDNFGFLALISCTNITAKNADVCGVVIANTTNSTISNVSSHNCRTGIYVLLDSNDISITNCELYDNDYGIFFMPTSSNITNCNAYDNNYGFYIFGSSNCNIMNCTAHDNKYYGFWLEYQTTDTNVINCTAYNHKTSYGIYVKQSTGNSVIDCTVYDNKIGIYVYYGASDNNVINCNAYNHVKYSGIYLYRSPDCNVVGCNVYDNRNGIYIFDSSNCNVIDCNAYNNSYYGIYFNVGATDNNVINCNIYNNDKYGIYLGSACSNNNFSNCNVYGSNVGIYMIFVSGSNISKCNVYDNKQYGISIFYMSPNNDITNCNVYNNSMCGIDLYMSPDCDIIDCNVYNNFIYGIYIGSSDRNVVANCEVYSNMYGIYLSTSSNNELSDNTIYDNAYNFGIEGTDISQFHHYIEPTNTVDEKPIWYLVEQKNETLDESHNFGYLGLISCTNITAKNADVCGVVIANTTNSTISNVLSHNSSLGINLFQSSSNTITNCNTCNNAKDGIYLYGSSNNSILNCTSYNNAKKGIHLSESSNNNLMYHSNFVNNKNNAYEEGCGLNTWDDDYPSGGNYWSDYSGVDNYSGPGQNISGSDGIGDTPYNISEGDNQDRYPLMVPLDDTPPVITGVAATPGVQSTTEPVNITCTVTDNLDLVDTVKVNISGPEGFTMEATMNEGSYYYEDTYTTMGVYEYYIWVNDTNGNTAISDTYSFVITDLDTPISAVNLLSAWTRVVPFTVTAAAYDNTGVVNVTLYYRYSENGMDWPEDWTSYGTDEEEPWSWGFTGTEGDGYYEFYSIAVDDYGNVEEPPSTADASTGVDTLPPVTTIEFSGTMGGDGWYTSVVKVTLPATDALSGVASTWYKLDSGFLKLYTAPFTVSGEGQHTVEAYSFDVVGNKEDPESAGFKIDKVPPVTEHKFGGVIGKEGWFVSNVTVTFSVKDVFSGVNYTKYKLDEGEWTTYVDLFVVTEDGEHTLYYYSVDLAGNTETTKEVAFKIDHDTEPPVTTHEFDGIPGDNDWFTSDVVVTLTAEDDSASVDYTMYMLEDDTEWQIYTGPILVTEDDEHTIEYYSVDKVGNEEDPCDPVDFKSDQTPPTIDLTVEKTGLTKWLLTADVSDATSGVAKVEFYLDGKLLGEVTTSPYEWEVSEKGMAQAFVYDNAGNKAISDEVPVSVSQSQSSSSTPVPLQILSWLFGLW